VAVSRPSSPPLAAGRRRPSARAPRRTRTAGPSASGVVAAPAPTVAGLVRAVYQAGAAVATLAKQLVVDTVRAAESIAGDSVRHAPSPVHTAASRNKKARRRTS
jgi:hypothetical protein